MKPEYSNKIRAMILDMDGVLWRADQPIGDLRRIFNRFEQNRCRVVLATNNATRTVEQFLDKLRGFGVELEDWQVITSSQAATRLLLDHHPQGGPVFIIGEEGLAHELSKNGFYQSEKEAIAVVVGMDRHLTYEKLKIAALLIQTGVMFVGTNPDRSFPTPSGLIPGSGAILAALETATSVKPIIVGKPSPELYLIALERLGVSPSETLVVGDRLETDIAGAQVLGCYTALVLSGVSDNDDVMQWVPAPDFISSDLSSLLETLWSN